MTARIFGFAPTYSGPRTAVTTGLPPPPYPVKNPFKATP